MHQINVPHFHILKNSSILPKNTLSWRKNSLILRESKEFLLENELY